MGTSFGLIQMHMFYSDNGGQTKLDVSEGIVYPLLLSEEWT